MKRALIVACVLALIGPSYANIINVTLETNYGDIGLALDHDTAPITVDNFLNYVNDDFYDGLIFHRVISGFMIQGGGHDQSLNYITPTYGPIVNESDNGLSNLRGTIAMARGGGFDSATSQFFINHDDNMGLDQAYAVFGEVTFGLNVIDAIAGVTYGTEVSPNMGWQMQNVPVDDVIINSVYITVPEPATIIVLGMGGLSLLKR